MGAESGGLKLELRIPVNTSLLLYALHTLLFDTNLSLGFIPEYRTDS